MTKKNPKGWQVVTYEDLEENIEDSKADDLKKEGQPQEAQENETQKSEEIKKTKRKYLRPLIWGDLSTKPYWQRNLIPVLMEMFFLLFCFELPVKNIIHVKFVFYIALLLFYIFTKSISLKQLWRNVMTGFYFWKATLVCCLMYGAVYGITEVIINYVPTINLGFYPMTIAGPFTLVLFSITRLILAPIVEETFFRGNLISFHSKRFILLTSVVSVLLYAINSAFTPWAIIISIIWALPMTLIFLKTRNFYVTMGAHFVVSLIKNLPIIIKFLAVGA